jgi:hypothetical protein
LEAVLEQLWNQVMGPVVARLADLAIEPGAELVLLPQADLALLPLHAAGPRGGRCVLDDYIVSYAPSGYVLRTAQERLVQWRREGLLDAAGRGRDLFGVFNPMAGTRDELPLAEKVEMLALAGLFEGLGQSAWVYAGGAATVDRVLKEAGRAGYAHLSYHGGFNLADPEHSGLQLTGDATLTVTAIVRYLRLEHCRLVALSACESGMVDVSHLPNEFVGLPAVFLQAGAPGGGGDILERARRPDGAADAGVLRAPPHRRPGGRGHGTGGGAARGGAVAAPPRHGDRRWLRVHEIRGSTRTLDAGASGPPSRRPLSGGCFRKFPHWARATVSPHELLIIGRPG